MCASGVVGGLIFAAKLDSIVQKISRSSAYHKHNSQHAKTKIFYFGTKSQVTLLRGARVAPEAEPNRGWRWAAPGLTDSDPTHTCECFCILISVLTVTLALRTLM